MKRRNIKMIRAFLCNKGRREKATQIRATPVAHQRKRLEKKVIEKQWGRKNRLLLHSATLSLFHSAILSFWLYYLLSSFPSIAATLFYLPLLFSIYRYSLLFAVYFLCYFSRLSSSFFLLAFLLFNFRSLSAVYFVCYFSPVLFFLFLLFFYSFSFLPFFFFYSFYSLYLFLFSFFSFLFYMCVKKNWYL